MNDLPEWTPDEYLPEWTPESEQKNEEPQKGWEAVWKDVLSAAQKAPGEIGEGFMNLGPAAIAGGKTFAKSPSQGIEDIVTGLARIPRSIGNIPAITTEYLRQKGIQVPGVDMERPVQKPFKPTEWESSVLDRPEEGHQFLQSLGTYAPTSLVPGIGSQALATSLIAAGQEQNPLTGAGMVLAPELAGKGISKVAEKTSPLNLMKGNISPEELSANLRASQGTDTPIGRVLQNPVLAKAFENVTAEIPFSGGKDILSNIKQQVENKATETVESLRPENITGDLNDITQSLLQEAYRKQKDIKNELFTERNQIAEKEGHVLDLPDFKNTAKKITESIEDSPLYKDDPKFRSQYNRLMGYKERVSDKFAPSEILDQYGKPIDIESYASVGKKPSLTEAQVTAGDLYERAQKLKRSPNAKEQILGNNLQDLSFALKRDIENSVSKGSESLKKAHETANKNFKENFAPFKDEEVFEKITQKEPQKIVHEIIKPGKKTDQYRDIEKINALLPDDQKNLLGYTYLKGAEDKYGKINPKELASLINSLGNRQFLSLFPDKAIRDSLLDYSRLRGMNEEALNVLYNPKTGARNVGNLIGMGQLSFMLQHPIAAISPTIGGAVLNKAFTSEAIRNAIVKRMIENSYKKPEFGATGILSKYFTPALMSSQNQQ